MKPKYKAIHKELVSRLKDGTYPEGSRLPTEHDLAKEFGVNRHTLRRAVGCLVDDGYIDRAPRRGCVVIAKPGTLNMTTVWLYLPSDITGTWQPALEKLKAGFEETHPYRLEIVLYDRSGPVLTPELPPLEEQGPVLLSLAYGATHAASGMLEPLEDMADFHQTVKAVDGRLLQELPGPDGRRHFYLIPYRLGAWMMLANRTLLEELGMGDVQPPRHWEDFRELARQIREAGRERDIYPLDLDFFNTPQSYARFTTWFLNANGGRQLIDPETQVVQFDLPENRALLRFWQQLATDDLASPRGLRDGFLKRRSALMLSMTQSGHAHAPEWLGDDNIEAWPYPTRRPQDRQLTLMRGDFLGLMARTVQRDEDRQAAWAFLRYIVSEESQQLLIEETGALPVRTDCGYILDRESTRYRFFDFAMHHGQPMFDVARNDDIHHVLCTTTAQCIIGGAIDYLVPQAHDLIEQYVTGHQRAQDSVPLASEAFL